jgi:hypothetical protein
MCIRCSVCDAASRATIVVQSGGGDGTAHDNAELVESLARQAAQEGRAVAGHTAWTAATSRDVRGRGVPLLRPRSQLAAHLPGHHGTERAAITSHDDDDDGGGGGGSGSPSLPSSLDVRGAELTAGDRVAGSHRSGSSGDSVGVGAGTAAAAPRGRGKTARSHGARSMVAEALMRDDDRVVVGDGDGGTDGDGDGSGDAPVTVEGGLQLPPAPSAPTSPPPPAALHVVSAPSTLRVSGVPSPPPVVGRRAGATRAASPTSPAPSLSLSPSSSLSQSAKDSFSLMFRTLWGGGVRALRYMGPFRHPKPICLTVRITKAGPELRWPGMHS